jgi:predicted GIY-YIG superfamily endonuclease
VLCNSFFYFYLILMTDKTHYCYIIKNKDVTKNNTYCGYTVNPQRRLKQHNGELKGGAKATHGKSWEFMIIIKGFRDYHHALSVEYKLKHPDGKRRKNKIYCGIGGRIKGLIEVLKKEECNFTVYILDQYAEQLNEISENAKIDSLSNFTF